MKTLQQFKDALKAILDKQEKQELLVNKALRMEEVLQKARRVYAVGEHATWKGKEYVKQSDGKWKRFYRNEGRGIRNAFAHLRKRIDACETNEQLMKLVLENRSRFCDEDGHPLPIVTELYESIDKKSAELEGNEAQEKEKLPITPKLIKVAQEMGVGTKSDDTKTVVTPKLPVTTKLAELVKETKEKEKEREEKERQEKGYKDEEEWIKETPRLKYGPMCEIKDRINYVRNYVAYSKEEKEWRIKALEELLAKKEKAVRPNLDEFINDFTTKGRKQLKESKGNKYSDTVSYWVGESINYPMNELKAKLRKVHGELQNLKYGVIKLTPEEITSLKDVEHLLNLAIARRGASLTAREEDAQIGERKKSDKPVGTNYPCYETMPDNEKKFYTMTRAKLESYITENIADEIQDADKAETKTLADFCRAHTRIKEFVHNLPKLKSFHGYKNIKDRCALAYYCGGEIGAARPNKMMEVKTEGCGKACDVSRQTDEVPTNIIRDSGNGVRDVFIHEFGHYIDALCKSTTPGWERQKEVEYHDSKASGTCVSVYGGSLARKDARAKTNHPVEEFTAELFASFVIFGEESLTKSQATLMHRMIDIVNNR